MKLYRLAVVAVMLTFASCSKSGSELKTELIGEWQLVDDCEFPCCLKLNIDGSCSVSNLLMESDFGGPEPIHPQKRERQVLFHGNGNWDVTRDLWRSFDDLIFFKFDLVDDSGQDPWIITEEGHIVKSDGELSIQFVDGDPDSFEWKVYRRITKGNNKRHLRRKGKKSRKD